MKRLLINFLVSFSENFSTETLKLLRHTLENLKGSSTPKVRALQENYNASAQFCQIKINCPIWVIRYPCHIFPLRNFLNTISFQELLHKIVLGDFGIPKSVLARVWKGPLCLRGALVIEWVCLSSTKFLFAPLPILSPFKRWISLSWGKRIN